MKQTQYSRKLSANQFNNIRSQLSKSESLLKLLKYSNTLMILSID